MLNFQIILFKSSIINYSIEMISHENGSDRAESETKL